MELLKVIRFVINHPLNKDRKLKAFINFIKWQIKFRIINRPLIYKFTDKTNLVVEKGMRGATGNIYVGLHEFEDMGFLLHFLREQDVFVDVGANIGTYTILASGHVGCRSIAIEPIPSTFLKLKRNIEINSINNKVRLLNLGVSSSLGELRFTTGYDSMNHVINESKYPDKSVIVRTDSLNNILSSEEMPSLLKIDVEGYEYEVLQGGFELMRSANLKAIIIELNGSGIKYGKTDEEINKVLVDIGYKPYGYDPLRRKLSPIPYRLKQNTLYIRDLDEVASRVSSADKFQVAGLNI